MDSVADVNCIRLELITLKFNIRGTTQNNIYLLLFCLENWSSETLIARSMRMHVRSSKWAMWWLYIYTFYTDAFTH